MIGNPKYRETPSAESSSEEETPGSGDEAQRIGRRGGRNGGVHGGGIPDKTKR